MPMAYTQKIETVVETHVYLREAAKIFTEEERSAISFAIAAAPEMGDIIPGSGGYRKRRFGRTGIGKRGGARVVYLYRDNKRPIFLMTAYSKSDRQNLSKAELNAMAKIADRIFEEYGGSRG